MFELRQKEVTLKNLNKEISLTQIGVIKKQNKNFITNNFSVE